MPLFSSNRHAGLTVRLDHRGSIPAPRGSSLASVSLARPTADDQEAAAPSISSWSQSPTEADSRCDRDRALIGGCSAVPGPAVRPTTLTNKLTCSLATAADSRPQLASAIASRVSRLYGAAVLLGALPTNLP